MREAAPPSRQLGVVILVAILGLGLAVLASRSRLGRLSNLKVPGDFTEVYVQFKVGDGERCLVADRGGVTERRSEPGLQPARWSCRHSGRDGDGLLALDGKRASFLFVPYEKVVDPLFPFLYEELRQVPGEPALPRLRWVHLFVDRTYRGFYLQATLPTRDFSEEKGLGELEMLVAQGGELFCFDRKLRGICPIYGGLIAESIFPQPAWPPGAGRLAALLPAELPRAFLLSEKGADSLRAWPLPFSLPELVGGEVRPFADERLAAWRAAPAASALPAVKTRQPPARLAEQLRAAVAASCAARGCDAAGESAKIAGSPTLAYLEGAGT